MPEPLTIRDRIRAVLSEGVSREVSEICDLVTSGMSAEDMVVAFPDMLPLMVRSVIHEQSRPTFPRPVGGRSQTPPLPVGKQKHVRSAKVTAIRNDWWARKLLDTRQVEGRRKVVAEFTVDDALAVAVGLRRQAETDAAEAVRWDALAKAMKDAGVEFARDLPADVGFGIWNTQEAAA